jgi:diguanylate cyclase (GGDEF)-like protein
MNLPEAINALELAVKEALESALEEIVRAASTDDRAPLGNALALKEASSMVGTAEGQFDVVIFADLNRLKSLNERHGHVAGDAAISLVGGLIDELIVRGCGAKGFRRSGDEFVILMSSHVPDRFREMTRSFRSCSFPFNQETLSTSASFGYAIGEGEASYDELLAKAETACVKIAKAEGGGSCVPWSEDIEEKYVSNLRGRCSTCGATFVCDVPLGTALKDGTLSWCPCCGKSLAT